MQGRADKLGKARRGRVARLWQGKADKIGKADRLGYSRQGR
jgi:hypothetical protein